MSTKPPNTQDMSPEALEAAGKIPVRGVAEPGIDPDEDEGLFASVWNAIDKGD